jgi:hypothetical protein
MAQGGYTFSSSPELQAEHWKELALRGRELGLKFYQFSFVRSSSMCDACLCDV